MPERKPLMSSTWKTTEEKHP